VSCLFFLIQNRTQPWPEFVIANILRECLEDIQSSWRLTGYPVIVMGTINDSSRVPANLLGCFKQEIKFEVGISCDVDAHFEKQTFYAAGS